ncbi:MAG TPA: GAF domain-containing sensor histidine kinase [Thermoanaerobaculia bacterium]|nr:GAF domain-containing sensor histidine kinase [Thermoanaerobaculia bacterium]
MTLKRLRIVAVVSPIAVVVILELVRTLTIGAISWEKRLILDLVTVGAIVLFLSILFSFVDDMQTQLVRQNQELLALHGAGLDVAAELSLDAVLKKVVDQAKNLVGAKYGAVSVIDDHGRIQTFITSGISTEEREAIGPPPVGHGLLGVVLHHGQRLRLADITTDPRSHGFPAHHPPMHSLLAVPIVCKGPFRGNLYVSEKIRAKEFTKDDEETIERFAVQAAIAIDNAHLHEQVADLAVAQERVRIAHEMHDGLAQVLGYVNTKVQAADAYLKRGKTEEASTQLHELASAAREAYTDVRESIVDLRTMPTPHRSLPDVLREYFERWQEMSGIAVALDLDADVRLRPGVELQLVRIVQESLTNVRKHAKASNAHVTIRRNGTNAVATIIDDGIGFNQLARTRGEFPRFGLTTMLERAEAVGGTLTIDSVPGTGTTVRFELPLE